MSHFQPVRPRSSKIHPGVAVVSFVVSPSRVIVKRSIKKRFRGKRINKLVGYYIYGADLQSFITRAFSNAEASLQFRDLFVPTGCWGEKKCKGEGRGEGVVGELGVCVGQKRERKTCEKDVSSFP